MSIIASSAAVFSYIASYWLTTCRPKEMSLSFNILSLNNIMKLLMSNRILKKFVIDDAIHMCMLQLGAGLTFNGMSAS